ncbi:MAG: hypothetical protein HKN70_09935 [Gammaproteobacteria bacterium]|nr:hypothetical protein [Gammaproteobacteria bacterium]
MRQIRARNLLTVLIICFAMPGIAGLKAAEFAVGTQQGLQEQAMGGSAVDRGVTEPLRVMTRNIYVGADIFRVVTLTDPVAILLEVAAVYQTVQDTDFTARAEVLADEVLLHQPHVIGLQEVSLIRRQSPGDVLSGNPVAATDVESDYLQILLAALNARGLDYTAAVIVENADIELPLIGPVLDDIRLTDQDVILVRDDVPFGDIQSANYADNVIIDLSGALINFNRGYTRLDVVVGGIPYHIVNTHLEVGSQGTIQALQAEELISDLADEHLPIVMLGDFNSSPLSPPNEAYDLIQNAGFVDLWTVRSIDDTDPGYTCCHDETLLDPATTFSSRIDLVWARFGATTVLENVEATVVGQDPSMRTPSGLWPSDHGGVIATFEIIGADSDQDGDEVVDGLDNCLLLANADQRDTNDDGFGNVCDTDFNQDGVTNFLDVAIFAANFELAVPDPDVDLDGDGMVNFSELATIRDYFLQPPGPSGVMPALQ